MQEAISIRYIYARVEYSRQRYLRGREPGSVSQTNGPLSSFLMKEGIVPWSGNTSWFLQKISAATVPRLPEERCQLPLPAERDSLSAASSPVTHLQI